MIDTKTLKIIFVSSLVFLLFAGCGGGTTNGSPEKVMGPVSTVSSSVPVALNQVFSDGTTSSSSLRLNMEDSEPNDEDSDDFAQCAMTENPDGSFTITCACMANGVTQGTVVHSFDNQVTRGTCTRADGTTGKTIVLDGTGVTTFDHCLVEKCGTLLTLDGVVNETVHHSRNTCDRTVSTTVDFMTAGACSGLTLTEGPTTSTIGLTVAVTRNQARPTVTGTICIDTISMPFASLADLEGIIDPAGLCKGDVDDDDGDDVNDED